MIKEPDLCDICAKSDKCPDSTNNVPGIIRVFCSRFEDVDNREAAPTQLYDIVDEIDDIAETMRGDTE